MCVRTVYKAIWKYTFGGKPSAVVMRLSKCALCIDAVNLIQLTIHVKIIYLIIICIYLCIIGLSLNVHQHKQIEIRANIFKS